MACKMFCFLGLIFFGFYLTNARVFYVDGIPENIRSPPARTSREYPRIYPNIEESEQQASRDLDLSFSAGEPNEIPEGRSLVYPTKLYTTPERQIMNINRDYDRPVSYYRIVGAPARRIIYDDSFPVASRKLVNFSNDGSHKNEVVLELRVTANNDNNEGI